MAILASARRRLGWVVAFACVGLAGASAPVAEAGPVDSPPVAVSHAAGHVTDRMDWSQVNDATYPPRSTARTSSVGLPAQFDLRTVGEVGPVRDQGAGGDCWAYAATGSAASGISRQGWDSVVLSPTHLVYSSYNALGIMHWTYGTGAMVATSPLMDGGNDVLASSVWSKMYGAQPESAYPRSKANKALTLDQVRTSAYHQRDAWILPTDFDSKGRFSMANVTAVKEALTNYGALSVSYAADNGQVMGRRSLVYNPATAAVYNSVANVYPNHAVLMIGWDDAFPASGFSNRPPGDGAWLIQNSWGTGTDKGGYFWLSYYDLSESEVWFYNLVPAARDDVQHVIFLDDGPPADGIRAKTTVGYGANILQVPADAGPQSLRAVSIFFGAPFEAYEISIYVNPTTTPTSGQRVDVSSSSGKAVTGTIANAGWNRINLDLPVTLQPSDKFAVVVKVIDPTSPVIFYRETADAMGSIDSANNLWIAQAYVVSDAGQSFTSDRGISWTDVATNNQGNLAIKALTADVSGATPPSASPSASPSVAPSSAHPSASPSLAPPSAHPSAGSSVVPVGPSPSASPSASVVPVGPSPSASVVPVGPSPSASVVPVGPSPSASVVPVGPSPSASPSPSVVPSGPSASPSVVPSSVSPSSSSSAASPSSSPSVQLSVASPSPAATPTRFQAMLKYLMESVRALIPQLTDLLAKLGVLTLPK